MLNMEKEDIHKELLNKNVTKGRHDKSIKHLNDR